MIANNTVTGQGPVDYIAQNGIQVGYGAEATVTENTVTGNAYRGPNQASSGGILVVGGPFFDSPGFDSPYTVGLKITRNTLTNNDVGVFLFNADENGLAPKTHTKNSVKLNAITNDAVTNTTGQRRDQTSVRVGTRRGSRRWLQGSHRQQRDQRCRLLADQRRLRRHTGRLCALHRRGSVGSRPQEQQVSSVQARRRGFPSSSFVPGINLLRL